MHFPIRAPIRVARYILRAEKSFFGPLSVAKPRIIDLSKFVIHAADSVRGIRCCTHLPSDQQTCFQEFLDAKGGQSGASGSSNGTAEEALPAECSYISTQISDCVSSTSGFTTLANSDQASCICFNTDGSWNGTVWDNAATTCYQAISSAGRANASALNAYDSGVVGFCTKFVDAGILSSAGVSVSSGGGGVAVSIGLRIPVSHLETFRHSKAHSGSM